MTFSRMQLAITLEGLLLGMLERESFDRETGSFDDVHDRRKLAIEDKESHRWLKGYLTDFDVQTLCPDTQVVSMADREGGHLRSVSPVSSNVNRSKF